MHYHLFHLRDGQIPLIDVGLGRPVFLRSREVSASVLIPIQQLEEVGVLRFLEEVPRMATIQLGEGLSQLLGELRAPVAWDHFLFAIRCPVMAFFNVAEVDASEAGLPDTGEPIRCVGFVFSLQLALGISPREPIGPDETFYMSFPFFSCGLADTTDHNLEEMLTTSEGQQQLERMLNDCFQIGVRNIPLDDSRPG